MYEAQIVACFAVLDVCMIILSRMQQGLSWLSPYMRDPIDEVLYDSTASPSTSSFRAHRGIIVNFDLQAPSLSILKAYRAWHCSAATSWQLTLSLTSWRLRLLGNHGFTQWRCLSWTLWTGLVKIVQHHHLLTGAKENGSYLGGWCWCPQLHNVFVTST